MVTSLVIFKANARPVHPGAFVTPRLLKVRLVCSKNGGSFIFIYSEMVFSRLLYFYLSDWCSAIYHTVSILVALVKMGVGGGKKFSLLMTGKSGRRPVREEHQLDRIGLE